jgi:hypothetical protein
MTTQGFAEGSLRVGDELVVRCDVLAEQARSSPASPHAWRFVPAGTTGRLIGWRDRVDDARAVVDVGGGGHRRVIVFVREHNVTQA